MAAPRSVSATHLIAVGVMLVLAIALPSLLVREAVMREAETPLPSQSALVGSAAHALDSLTVRGRAPMTGYERDSYAWNEADTDANGCRTRDDILRRDLRVTHTRYATRGCGVYRGVLIDPYSGARVDFQHGQRTSMAVQIDHVVALGNAHASGAWRWDEETKVRFANDPLNLRAVDGALNQAKSDSDAATWLPPRTSFRCTYVASQIQVKSAYSLSVTPAEKDAMAAVLATCPEQQMNRPARVPAPNGS